MKRIVTTLVPFLFIIHSYAQGQDTVPSMTKDGGSLKEVVIMGNNKKNIQMKSSLNLVRIGKSYLEKNLSGSLMQTLAGIPGVKAMNIGSGQSKPAIRGLGFNRMVVTENGIKHEGQQWGEDHGLEIDQFAIDRVEVIKGPAALLYGSDAIGGAINLYSDYIPERLFEGKAEVFMRSNNESMGLSAQAMGRRKRFYYKANMTLIDYADYKVPADSIQYYSYYIKLKNRHLRNTAGKEYDGSFTLGYAGEHFSTDFKVSNIYAKSGFFANAHGLEVRLSDIDYDRSKRDIDLPYHFVDHLKIMNHSAWKTGSFHWESHLSFQNNLREELSEPVSHGYMPIPPNTLERKYVKQTYTAGISTKVLIAGKHDLNAGVGMEYQHNRRAGWGFIIPDFETASIGGYVLDRCHLSEDFILSAGLRLDKINTHIHAYSDWYETPGGSTGPVYKERSAELDPSFTSLTGSLGLNYALGQWMLKMNLGKSFRVPIPKELGADGVNYHIFRYEKGSPQLSPEESYQIDAGINWHNRLAGIQVEPYLNYFPNYIYLNPTPNYTEGLQTYYYTQSRVMRYGLEAELTYKFLRNLEAGLKGEYLHARQLSGDKKGYTLPFSPPWTGSLELKYTLPLWRKSGASFVSALFRVVGDQDEIVPPEEATKGYGVLDMAVGKIFAWKDYRLRLNLKGINLLNRRYYDHTSYYRLIDVPEPGRNFSLMIGFDF